MNACKSVQQAGCNISGVQQTSATVVCNSGVQQSDSGVQQWGTTVVCNSGCARLPGWCHKRQDLRAREVCKGGVQGTCVRCDHCDVM